METDIKKRAYFFSLRAVKFVNSIESKRMHFSLVDQLLRSAISIGANLIEARAAHSRRDFIKYYEIALKSANETKYWLCLLRDALDASPAEVKTLLSEADEISKIIATIIVKLKKRGKPLPSVEEEELVYSPF